jgi:hypothetical protein
VTQPPQYPNQPQGSVQPTGSPLFRPAQPPLQPNPNQPQSPAQATGNPAFRPAQPQLQPNPNQTPPFTGPNTAPGAATTPPPVKKRPWFKSPWVLAPATLVLGIIIGAASGGSSSAAANAARTVTATATVTSTSAQADKAAATVTVTAPAVTVTAAPAAPATTAAAAPAAIEDGTYIVGTDIALGTWKSSGGASDLCYADTEDKSGKILEQEVSSGPSVVIRIKSGAYTFKAAGCGTWTKVG